VPKGKLGELINNTYNTCGRGGTVDLLDRLKELGFNDRHPCRVSIGMEDMIIPAGKADIVERPGSGSTRSPVIPQGIITGGERYNKVIDIWTSATDEIAKAVFTATRPQRRQGRR
jgi:DNA-directed RNA polymerase subunit beta'